MSIKSILSIKSVNVLSLAASGSRNDWEDWAHCANGMSPADAVCPECFIAAPSVPDGWLRKLSQSAAPESYLKTIYKARCAGVESEKRGQAESMKPKNIPSLPRLPSTPKLVKTYCAGVVSKMGNRDGRHRHNGLREMSKTSGKPIGPIGPIGPIKTLCSTGVQNEVRRCPKCVNQVSG